MGFLDRLVGKRRPAHLFSGGLPLRSSSPPDPLFSGGRPARPLDAWRDLPSMPGTLREPPTTLQAAAFEAGLVSRHAPAFLGTLGHRLAAAAPAGTVRGLATPAAAADSESHEAAGGPVDSGGDHAGNLLLSSPATGLVTAPAPDLPSLSLPSLAVGREPGAPAAPDRTAQEGPPAGEPLAGVGSSAGAAVVDPGSDVPPGASLDGPGTGTALLGDRPVQRALGQEPAAPQPPSGVAAVLPAATPEPGAAPAGPEARPARRVGLGPPVAGGTTQRATGAPPAGQRAARQAPPTAQAWPSAGRVGSSAGMAAPGGSAPPGGEISPSIRQGTSPFGEVSPPGGRAVSSSVPASPPGVQVSRSAGQPSPSQGQLSPSGGQAALSGGSGARSEAQVSRSSGQALSAGGWGAPSEGPVSGSAAQVPPSSGRAAPPAEAAGLSQATGSPPEPDGPTGRGADSSGGAAADATSAPGPAAAAGPSPGAAGALPPPLAAVPPGEAATDSGVTGVAPLGEASRGQSAVEAEGVEVLPLLGERSGLGPPAGGPPPLQRSAAGRGDGPGRQAAPPAAPGAGPVPRTTGGGAGAGPAPFGQGAAGRGGAGDTTAAGSEPAAAAAGPYGAAAGPDSPAPPGGADLSGGRTETADPTASGGDPTEATDLAAPAEAAPAAAIAPLLGERPVVLASLFAIDAAAPAEVRRQAPGEPAGLPAAAAEPGRAGLRGSRPGSFLGGTRVPRAGPLGHGPPGGHPHPTGVRLPGGPPAPPTGPVAQATGPVAQRAAPLAPTGAALDPAALALASGVASPDGAGGLRFAPPAAAGPTVQLAGVATDLSERFSAAATGAAEQLAGRSEQLAGAVAGPVNPPAAAAAGPAGAAAQAGAAPADLDDLARRLYDRLRSRLMAELRLDRERAGLVTDLRH